MAKLTIMQGLPASGKTTRAAELHQSANTIRINRDLLRTMLHFDKWTGKNESITRDAARTLAAVFLESGINVIIDDTNLNPSVLQAWKDLGKKYATKIEYQIMDTPYEECLKRNEMRTPKVPSHVITTMALESGLYPLPSKPIVICDLDGTLCNIDHRLHHVKGDKKDWKSFFTELHLDTVDEEVASMVRVYQAKGHELFFVSGRPDTYRAETEAWLHAQGFAYNGLIMRKASDSRQDTQVKQEIYTKYFSHLPIEAVIDDRPSVIRMWKELELNVIDMSKGVEF